MDYTSSTSSIEGIFSKIIKGICVFRKSCRLQQTERKSDPMICKSRRRREQKTKSQIQTDLKKEHPKRQAEGKAEKLTDLWKELTITEKLRVLEIQKAFLSRF